MSIKKTKYTTTKVTKKDVNIKIDIEKLLGKGSTNNAITETFFQLAFDKMMERLSSGLDVNGKAMAKYSDAYKDSASFEIFGKSNTVNMQLTGDMVNDVQILNQTEKTMKIGFTDADNDAKAFAHITGFEDHPTLEGKVKPRQWFGWTDKDLESIAKEIRPAIEEAPTISDSAVLNLLEKLVG